MSKNFFWGWMLLARRRCLRPSCLETCMVMGRKPLRYQKEEWREKAYEAPPSPEGSVNWQDFSEMPNPFEKARAKIVYVKEDVVVCAKCDTPIPPKPLALSAHRVQCDACQRCFHFGCVGLSPTP
eukprot:GGOE01021610.1.p1 GENE.GGOE01021610.1~~GGOE01021610.1.p1  ORF type:complete len:125 (+),score=1.03 GGOE01021610.1:79-453(+)